MTVIYNMSIDRADKPWIGDRRLTEHSRHAPSTRAQCAAMAHALPPKSDNLRWLLL